MILVIFRTCLSFIGYFNKILMNLNNCIDHTLLVPAATSKEIRQLCAKEVAHDFYAECVNSSRVKFTAKELCLNRD